MNTPIYSPQPIRCISYEDLYSRSESEESTSDIWNDIEVMNRWVHDLCILSNDIQHELKKERVI